MKHWRTLIIATLVSHAICAVTVIPAKAEDSACENTNLVASLAGDSITNAYWNTFRDIAPLAWDLSRVAEGGLRAPQFNGEEEKQGVLRDFTASLIDLDPEMVILMLGTNDSVVGWESLDHSIAFASYVESMRSILDRLQSHSISVLLGLPTPLQPISGKLAVGEERLASLYRPWLHSEAEARGLPVVDYYTLFISRSGWEDYFPDGVHPYTDEGAGLMAAEASSAFCTVLVPEPSTALLSAAALTSVGLVGLLKMRRRGRLSEPEKVKATAVTGT